MLHTYTPPFASLGITWVGLMIYSAIVFVAYAIPTFQLFRKANYRYAWIAFIPFLGIWALLRVLKASPWQMLWLILIVAECAINLFGPSAIAISVALIATFAWIAVTITWWVRLFKAFGMNPKWLLVLLGLIIPLVNMLVPIAIIVLFWTMAFNKDYLYQL